MKDEKGNEISQEEILKCGLDHLSDAACFLFELESVEGRALAFFTDGIIKCAEAVLHGEDPRSIITEEGYSKMIAKAAGKKKLKRIK